MTEKRYFQKWWWWVLLWLPLAVLLFNGTLINAHDRYARNDLEDILEPIVFSYMALFFLISFGANLKRKYSKSERDLRKRKALILEMMADRDVQEAVYDPAAGFSATQAPPIDELTLKAKYQVIWDRYHLQDYGVDGARGIFDEVTQILSAKELSPAEQLRRWEKFKRD